MRQSCDAVRIGTPQICFHKMPRDITRVIFEHPVCAKNSFADAKQIGRLHSNGFVIYFSHERKEGEGGDFERKGMSKSVYTFTFNEQV